MFWEDRDQMITNVLAGLSGTRIKQLVKNQY